MRIPMACLECVHNVDGALNVPSVSYVELQNNGIYKVTCANGHESITMLSNQKFEVLFELGAYAIVDGYYRESVANFASCLERFFEFFIKLKLRFVSKVEETVVRDAWKNISSQSERQLGAYVMMYTETFGCVPELLSNQQAKFRNGVIHKGEIPNRDEAIEFGQVILDIVISTKWALQDKYPDAVRAYVLHAQIDMFSRMGEQVGNMMLPTILSLGSAKNQEHPLKKSLEDAGWWRKHW